MVAVATAIPLSLYCPSSWIDGTSYAWRYIFPFGGIEMHIKTTNRTVIRVRLPTYVILFGVVGKVVGVL